jgi:hypothetical protein
MPQNSELQDWSTNVPLPLPQSKLAYRERLNSWAIARLLPNLKSQIVARFRSHSDADGHLKSLQQRLPDSQFVVMFDPPSPED